MAYNLALTNTSALTTIADGTADTNSSSLTLVGKNYPGYGVFLNENFIYLLENFANGTSPTKPLPGQLWWDSSNKALKVNAAATKNDNAVWKIISGGASGTSAPVAPIVGDLWWDSGNSQLKVYNGSTWVTIGPAFTTSTGQSGAIPGTIAGTDAVQHVIVKFFIANQLVAILSKDSTFTPAVAEVVALFPTIKPGFNLSNTTQPSLVYYGDSNSALNLNVSGTLVPSSRFLRNDQPLNITQQISAQTDAGFSLGASGQGLISIAGGQLTIKSVQVGQDIALRNSAGTAGLVMNGTSSLVTVISDPVSGLGIATKNYVDTANTSQTNAVDYKISTANTSQTMAVDYKITTANTAQTNSVDYKITTANTAQTNSVDYKITTANTAQTNSVDYKITTANVSLKSYVDYQLTLPTTGVTTANAAMKSYVDYQLTQPTTGITTANAAMKSYVDVRVVNGTANITTANIFASVDNVSNIGSPTSKYYNVHATTFRGTSINAQYADLAENYTADAEYAPGTVVVFGGDKEVTISTTSHDTRVAGVVSTKPAYLMNSESSGVAVALTGKTPCRVRGPVGKGDLLVTSDVPGVAQKLTESVMGSVIGKSMENIADANIHTVDVAVGRF